MRFGRKTSFVAGALVALVIGSGSAYAATGGKFILGYGNSAGQTSTLSNPNGTALALNSKAGTPSLKVNRNTKVPNLNSDLLDGMDQTRFALATGTTKVYPFRGKGEDLDNDGLIDYAYAFAQCPAGTQRTGGGMFDGTESGYVYYNSPNSNHGWIVAAMLDPNVTEDPAQLVAEVICYSPRGVPAGGYSRMAQPQPSAETMAMIERAAAAKHR